jgi:hypothetical protein
MANIPAKKNTKRRMGITKRFDIEVFQKNIAKVGRLKPWNIQATREIIV